MYWFYNNEPIWPPTAIVWGSKGLLSVPKYGLNDYWRHSTTVNTLRPRQNGRHFADDVFKCIFLSENLWISLTNSLKFVPKVRIYNILALVQIMAWRRSGDKPLYESLVIIGIDHDTVCAGVVGTAIRNSTSCAGRRVAACGRAGRHNECCSGLQYQPLQRRPYKWSISILPRS